MSKQDEIPANTNQIIDKALDHDQTEKSSKTKVEHVSVESWSIPISDIFENEDIRLDATHFNPKTAGAIKKLEDSGFELSPLSEFASVELRGQFTRIWAMDKTHGIPYFNATDMLSLLALGVPAGGPRYLSYVTKTNVDSLIVREGWLLMTCSGTIGRVFYVPKRIDGWAATHDLIRIIPYNSYTTGYLYSWLCSPTAQTQILSYTHGGQIDHVTDDQVAGILVPRISNKEMKNINTSVMKALESREKAIEFLAKFWDTE